MKSRSIALAVALALYATQGVAAEDSDALEEIVVTARRALAPGFGASTLDPASIARQRARTSDTASLLSGLPGVSAYGAGGVSSLPSIRGLADDRLRTQVDGMNLVAACPNHMNPPLSYIDPSAVADVDVYPGVTPVSVGGDSIGGSIVVRSADPAFAQANEHLVKGEAGGFYRSNGAGWGGNLSGTFATERWSVNYTGAYADSGNYRAGSDFKDYTFTGRAGHTLPKDEVGSTYYESSNQSVRLAWHSGRHLIDFAYSYQDIPQEGYPNQRMDLTENTNNQFNLAYTGSLEWATVRARVYHQETKHTMDFGEDRRFWYGSGPPPTGSGGTASVNGSPCSPISGTTMVNGTQVSCAAGMPMKSDGKNTGVILSAAIPLTGGSLVRVGGEYQAYRLDDWWPPSGSGMWPYAFLNVNDGQRDRYAGFGEWETRGERWSNIVGARFEYVDMDTGLVHGYNVDTYPLTGTGGMGNQTRDAALFNAQDHGKSDSNWDVSWIARFTPDTLQVYELGVAQKTRSPNLHERYTWSSWQMAAFMNNFVGDGNGYFGDVDLKPEVARTVSVSADWHDAGQSRWNVRVTPYYTKVHDYIDAIQWDSTTNAPRNAPVVGNFTVLRFVNQSAQLYGVDFSAMSQIASDDRYGRFAVKLVGSYTRGENEDTHDDLYNIMPLNGTLTLSQDLGYWHNAVEAEFVAAKDDVSQVRNEMATAGYGLVHLRSSYERDAWSVEIGIENLLDRFYDPPLGGAYVGQGTTMTVPPKPNQPQWGTPVPGAGRSFYAGVNLRF